MAWDVIRISEVRRPEESFTTLQSYLLPSLPSTANNGQAGIGFRINRKWKAHIVRVNSISPRIAEFVLCITKRYKRKIRTNNIILINNFNDVAETLGKPNHYTIVKGDFNVQIGKRANPKETATGKFGLELRNERGDMHLGRMGNIKKVQTHE